MKTFNYLSLFLVTGHGDNSTADRMGREGAAGVGTDSSVRSEGSSSSAQDAGGSDADDQSNADMQVCVQPFVII